MNQVNKSDAGTTAEGGDVFVISHSADRFKNLGSLSTTGDLASPIRVAAAGVVVSNKGALTTSGDGSPGITVGDPLGTFYDHVQIVNYGSIDTSGGVFDDGTRLAFADGIDVYGNDATVVNYGAIATSNPDTVGIGMVSSDSTVINHGTIHSVLFGILFDTAGDGTEIGNTTLNYGSIHTTGDESRAIAFNTGANFVANFGNLIADGIHSFGISMEGDGNRGENYGSILATGDEGRGVLLLGEHLSFDNHGTIQTTGVDSVGVRFAGENLPGTDGGTFTNHGSVESAGWAVEGSDSDDHVVNYGVMAGTIDLGAGNDLYVAGHGSSLAGELILGEGNDLVVAQRGFGDLTIADFLVGGSDDVLDISAYGYSSLDELLAHALQSGSDVILGLSGHDQLVLEDTALASLTANDFLFGGAGPLAIGGGFGSDFHADAGLGMHPDAAPLAA